MIQHFAMGTTPNTTAYFAIVRNDFFLSSDTRQYQHRNNYGCDGIPMRMHYAHLQCMVLHARTAVRMTERMCASRRSHTSQHVPVAILVQAP